MRPHRRRSRTVQAYSPGGANVPESSTQTASRLVQLFNAGLTSVTDRRTDHATGSATTDYIYIRSTGDVV